MIHTGARILFILIGIPAFLYFGLLLFLFIIQSRLVYFPAREIVFTPADRGLSYENVNLMTSDGVRITAWFVTAGKNGGAVLLCNGNGGNMSYSIQLIETLVKLDRAVFTFDYRGYGESDGSPDEEGTYRDVRAAWEYLTHKRGFAPEQIVIFGHSLGGAVCTHLAREVRPAAVILQSAFTSIPDLAQELYPFFPARYLARTRYPTRENLQAIHAPILILHSRQDEIVPLHHGRENFEAANEPKKFLELEGGHNTLFLHSEWQFQHEVGEFIRGIRR